MTTTFIEPGTAATGGLEFYTGVSGNVAASSTTTRNGNPTSLRVTPAASSTASADPAPQGFLGTAGRFSAYVCFDRFDSGSRVQSIADGLGSSTATVGLGNNTSGVLTIVDASNALIATGTNPLSTGTWYRVSAAWSITSSTVYTVKVFLNGNLEISVVNGTALSGGGTFFAIGCNHGDATATGTQLNISDIYCDDSSALTDTGNINLTSKLPAATNTNNFDTAVGSKPNRWDYVDQRPIDVSVYLAELGAADVQENFGLQGQTSGDASISGTLISRRAWIYAKRGPLISTAPKTTSTNAANSSGTTIVASGLSLAVNDVVVVAVADQMTSTTTVTIGDNSTGSHNTWNALSGPTTNTIRINKWYSIIADASLTTITATFTSQNASRAIAVAAWDNHLFSASPLDKNIANSNDSTSPYDCPATGVLAQADEIVLGFLADAGNATATVTSPSLNAAQVASSGGSAAGNSAINISYRVVSATTSIQPQFTLGTSRTGVVGTASFKYNTSGTRAAGTPKLMDNGSESSITLTGFGALYSLTTDSASYPSNAAGIGMRSSGAGGADTYFFEGGTIVAYIPSTSTWKTTNGLTVANTKTVDTLAKASIKTFVGLTP